MKPITLEITGLNSFRGKQVIDFAPLLCDGLFGIFGPTGSGKSTVLDAITLALYGKVRRAQNGKGGIINSHEKTCAVSFTFEIGSGANRKQYTVERNLARVRAKGEGKRVKGEGSIEIGEEPRNRGTEEPRVRGVVVSDGVETKRARLIEHRPDGEMPIADKQRDVDEKVLEIVGITYDDFLRAVVLPQGAFAEFLGMNQKDRGEMLQRLFGLHDFGWKLSANLKARSAKVDISRAEIDGEKAQLGEYDDEALATAASELEVATQLAADARLWLAGAKRASEEAVVLHDLLVEFAALHSRVTERAEREAQCDELSRTIDLADRACVVQRYLDVLDRAIQRHRDAELANEKAVTANNKIQQELTEAGASRDSARAERDTHYDRLCGELEQLRGMREQEKEIETAKQELAELASQIARLAAEREMRQSARSAAAAKHLELQEQVDRAERERSDVAVPLVERQRIEGLRLRVSELRNAHRSLLERETKHADLNASAGTLEFELGVAKEAEASGKEELRQVQSLLDAAREGQKLLSSRREELLSRYSVLNGCVGTIESIESRLKEDEARVVELRADTAALELKRSEVNLELGMTLEAQANARARKDELEELRESERSRQALMMLAPHLHPTQPCPLCGSIDHPDPYSADVEISGRLDELDRGIAELEQAIRSAEARVRVHGDRMAKIVTKIEGNNEGAERAELSIKTGRREVRDILAGIDEADPPTNLYALQKRIAAIFERGTSTAKELEATKRSIDDLVARVSDANAIVTNAAQDAAGLERVLSNIRQQIQKASEDLVRSRDEVAAARASFDELSPNTTPDVFEQEIQVIERREKESERLRLEIATMQEELAGVRETLESATMNLQRAELELKGSQSEHARLERQTNERASEAMRKKAAVGTPHEQSLPFADLIAEREQKRDALKIATERAELVFAAASEQAAASMRSVDLLMEQLRREQQERERVERECSDELRKSGFDSAEEARQALLSTEEIQGLKRELVTIQSDLDRERQRSTELHVKIAGRSIRPGEVETLRRKYAEAEAAHDEARTQVGVNEERLRECRLKNEELRELLERNRAVELQASAIDQLGRYLRGNAFVDFLANERLTDVCVQASARLAELTSGRYELLVRSGEGFTVRDYGNAGIERLPGSLSGGETFLVSLSLALALSDTIQLGQSPLEFFFLDEGFGTLDSELLETVMSSLERLRSDHRSIGVITHVGALRERITRRLVVHPALGEKGSRVEFEVA